MKILNTIENSQQSGEDIIYFTNYKSFKRVSINKENVDQLIRAYEKLATVLYDFLIFKKKNSLFL